MRLANAVAIYRGLLALIAVNCRNPVEVEGDIYSLMACNEVGGRRLVDMMREFGLADLDELGRHIIDSSRAGMLEEIRKLPRGSWTNYMRVDGFEKENDLVGTLTVTDDGIEVEFTGTSGAYTYGKIGRPAGWEKGVTAW